MDTYKHTYKNETFYSSIMEIRTIDRNITSKYLQDHGDKKDVVLKITDTYKSIT